MDPESSERSATVLRVALAALVGTLLLTSWVSGTYASRGFGDTQCRVLLSYSPAGPAFSIWSIIYVLTIINVTVQIVGELNEQDLYSSDLANPLHATAWGLAALWLPLFSYADTTSAVYVVSALVLLAMASAAYAAAVVCAQEWAPGGAEARRWTLAMPVSFFAGWTCTAAALNVGIAYMSNVHPKSKQCQLKRYPRNYWLFSHLFSLDEDTEDDEEDKLLQGVVTSDLSLVPLVLAASVVLVSLSRPDPILPLPLAWGTLFMRYTHFNFAAFVLCVAGVVAAFLRVYV